MGINTDYIKDRSVKTISAAHTIAARLRRAHRHREGQLLAEVRI